jgi:hypothetical protein
MLGNRSLWWIAYHRPVDGIAVNVWKRVDSTRLHTCFTVFRLREHDRAESTAV